MLHFKNSLHKGLALLLTCSFYLSQAQELCDDALVQGLEAISPVGVWEDPEANFERLRPWVAEAAAAGATVLAGGQVLIGLNEPLTAHEQNQESAARGVTLFALELVPRITRAQSMDVLSSMATIAGYQAVLEAASHLPRLFPMMMTAAGTLAPAKAFVVGVGVAGLQAIATAKRLGAVVEAYDVRPAVKDEPVPPPGTPGVVGRPSRATAENGRRIYEYLVDYISRRLDA